ncbi:L-rhamnose mutarotase [Alloprevotella tannerae]|uniref:L-rhamnose mutarotase n=1 Tax=Alloprevotella tannerae TaxID=76122 RepID=UPI00288C59FC|nr:L-rhamnose mutarotase [Alloprevotella tannerae]
MKILKQGYPVAAQAVPTKRYCQTLDLREDPELIAAYKKLHTKESIWPETLEAIKASGISEMEIYLLDNRLFMIIEMPANLEWDEVMQKMANMPKQKEWEALTAKYQQVTTKGENSADKWKLMERIFHLY